MSKLVLAPINRDQRTIEIDLNKWIDHLGDGGFAIALGCPGEPHHVLKCMDDEVSMFDAKSAMGRISNHARVMANRLSNIVSDSGTIPFARATCQTLLSTITTHVGYRPETKRIYLFQAKAPGQSLESALNGDPPGWIGRLLIALNFAKVMVALRRCNVVHLDCRPVNVFVDLSTNDMKVTLIDMDGCGVLLDRTSGEFHDRWQTPPVTMGRAEDMCRPVWYPWDPTWQMPFSGHFKFAERWCVINEIWKILSWGNPALSWLAPEHDALNDAHEKVQEMFKAGEAYLPGLKQEYLDNCHRAIANEMKEVLKSAIAHTKSIRWADYGFGSGSPQCESFFSEFGLATLLSFADPRDWRLPNSDKPRPGAGRQPAHRPEIPSAKWIQDHLLELSFTE